MMQYREKAATLWEVIERVKLEPDLSPADVEDQAWWLSSDHDDDGPTGRCIPCLLQCQELGFCPHRGGYPLKATRRIRVSVDGAVLSDMPHCDRCDPFDLYVFAKAEANPIGSIASPAQLKVEILPL